MAYSDFTFAKLKAKFGIDQKRVHLFRQTIVEFVPTSHLLDEIADGIESPLYSEKAKSEALDVYKRQATRCVHDSGAGGVLYIG